MAFHRPLRALFPLSALLALAFCGATAGARQAGTGGRFFYVAVDGSGSGTGELNRPWDLATALSQPSAVHPGDTIWLRGGTYRGAFTSVLTGTADAPIIVRQYPGERAILDGGDSDGRAILTIDGSYTWFWGFEVTSSDPVRRSAQAGSFPTDIGRGDGVSTGTSDSFGIKLINLTIHDARQGISAFSKWSDTEIYGCLIYYDGWVAPDRGHGHGIYTQNETGTKTVRDNIIFSGFGHGIHAYGTAAARLDNFRIEGNTIFVSGTLLDDNARNLLLGGDSVAQNPAIVTNYLYRHPNGPASDFDLGYDAGCSNATVTGNYISSNSYFVKCAPVLMTANAFLGSIVGFSVSQYPLNTFSSIVQTGVQTFVRPNQYEPNRANITVFNWDLEDSVAVDLSGILTPGDEFEIRNAQDVFGTPVLSGTYDGEMVPIPMSGLSVAAPVGWPTPAPTGPEFNAFVVTTTRARRADIASPDEGPRSPRTVSRPASPRDNP